MVSISADTFTVNRGHDVIILYDHSRKYRTRKFYLYPPQAMNSWQATAIKEIKLMGEVGRQVDLPRKMAFAMWLAWTAWKETQRSSR